MFNKLRKISKVFLALCAAIIVVVGILHHVNRWSTSVTKVTSASGEVVYTHSDPMTTHIINVLCGREQYTDEDITLILKEEYRHRGSLREQLPRDFSEKWSADDLYSFLIEQGEWQGASRLLWRNDYLHHWRPESPTLCARLWELEEKTGAPYVRWTFGRGLTISEVKDAHYNPFTHTAYTDLSFIKLVEELMHVDQFSNEPYWAYSESVRYGLRVGAKLLYYWNLEKAQAGEYLVEGGIEHDAHKVRGPKVMKDVINAFIADQTIRRAQEFLRDPYSL